MTPESPSNILHASWCNPRQLNVALRYDCDQTEELPLFLDSRSHPLKQIQQVPLIKYAQKSAYFRDKDSITFICFPDPKMPQDQKIYLAGNFNQWETVVGDERWRLKPKTIFNEKVLALTLDKEKLNLHSESLEVQVPILFKFVTKSKEWITINPEAPNIFMDESGNCNYILHPRRTGHHLFCCESPIAYSPSEMHELLWLEDSHEEHLPIDEHDILLNLGTKKALGAIVSQNKTTFRLFAPRATDVSVSFFKNLTDSKVHTCPMQCTGNSAWETVFSRNLHGYYYYYRIEGVNSDAFTHFDPNVNVLDPYAFATVGSQGPGIVIDKKRIKPKRSTFRTPSLHNLVILEAHVRDLLAHAPISLSKEERQGFSGLAKWVRAEGNYLTNLGVNAVELQPVQECDSKTADEYHWGYMPVNYFAPESSYALCPQKASQIQEFQDLVEAFHENDIAVILDVVYNHVGEPSHLLAIDKHYYFMTDAKGHLSNCSGCGNDLRVDTPMGRRLLIDSLTHLIKTYNVDGFRFDLAEMIGVDVLKEVESALKAVKPSVVLIAEPWSSRGHIGHNLRSIGFAPWNDGYREFLAQYLTGEGNRRGVSYFLSGSIDFMSNIPSQSVNYVASHDDYCWIDRITENPDHDGSSPTFNDVRRTHLMVAMLMCSTGVPMLAQGQDFLHSKQGLRNTYQRGDLNALDYTQISNHSSTHLYFKNWIAFRASKRGRLLRLKSRPEKTYFKFFYNKDSDNASIALLYNADNTFGSRQLIFAINPYLDPVFLKIPVLNTREFTQVADHNLFNIKGLKNPFTLEKGSIFMPPLSCALWLS